MSFNATRSFRRIARLASLCVFLVASAVQAEFPKFREVIIDPHADEICYAVTTADVNNDKKLDIVVVTEKRVLWYAAPSWKQHVILDGITARDNVCIAAHDIDGDGWIDFALGAGWTKIGTIQWIGRDKEDPTKWSVHMIGTERWTHRMRFADVLGKGKPQLVVSPLNKTVGPGVRLTALEIPANPRTDRWRPTVISDNLNRMHNHWHFDFDDNGEIDTLTASQEGVSIIRRQSDDFEQSLLPLTSGESHDGAGEIKVGHSKGESPFVVTVEPMHGNAVVVYSPTKDGFFEKTTLVDDLTRGHALWMSDLDKDGVDEIVMGHSDEATGKIKGPGVFVFDRQQGEAGNWSRHTIDNGGIATEDAIAVDLTGDGWPDIVACGRATHNVKLYVNLGVNQGQAKN